MNGKQTDKRVRQAMQGVLDNAQANDKPTLEKYMNSALKNYDQINTTTQQEATSVIQTGMKTVEGIIAAREEIICEMCLGWGHKAKQCASLKYLNKATKDTPSLKAAWGSLKSKYLSSAAEAMIVAGHKRRRDRKENLKEAPKKLSRTFIV